MVRVSVCVGVCGCVCERVSNNRGKAGEQRREQGEETLRGLRADIKCLPVTKRKGKV